jgi:hypothetical protein
MNQNIRNANGIRAERENMADLTVNAGLSGGRGKEVATICLGACSPQAAYTDGASAAVNFCV